MRTKHMIISIILGLALLAESVITAGLYVSRSKAQEQQCQSVLESAEREEENEKLRAEIERLRSEKSRLTHQLAGANQCINAVMSTLNAAKPQQKEPETGKIAAETGVSWSVERLPDCPTNTYRCMDYRKITQKNSAQIMLQDDDCTSTESGTGLRYSIIGDRKYYHAALASAYGLAIGNCFEFTLDNGYVIPVIHAEYKHAIEDAHADDFGDPDKNYAHTKTISVIEFVYDRQEASPEIIDRGGMFVEPFSDLSGVTGNIVGVKYLGRLWKP